MVDVTKQELALALTEACRQRGTLQEALEQAQATIAEYERAIRDLDSKWLNQKRDELRGCAALGEGGGKR